MIFGIKFNFFNLDVTDILNTMQTMLSKSKQIIYKINNVCFFCFFFALLYLNVMLLAFITLLFYVKTNYKNNY